jgi:predicted porin
MNNKLLAIGIAAALAVPFAAQAGVEVYGDARASVDFATNKAKTGEENTISLSSNYSYIGFKGDEDVGGGMSAVWQLEEGVAFDTNGSTITDVNGDTVTLSTFSPRQSFIGIAGGFGTVLGGNLLTPYRSATERLDPFHSTRADFNAIIGSFPGVAGGTGLLNDESYTNNTLAYMTPDMNGFSASLAFVLADASTGNDTLAGRTSATKDKNAYSLSAGYTNGPIFTTAAFESLNKFGLGAPGKDVTAWKIGGSYTIKDTTTIGALYENIDAGGTAGNRNAWSISIDHQMGFTTLKAAYNVADNTGLANTGADQFSLGISQALTKNTEVYALYTQVGNDSGAAYSLDNTPGVVTGKDMAAISVGITHMFSSK